MNTHTVQFEITEDPTQIPEHLRAEVANRIQYATQWHSLVDPTYAPSKIRVWVEVREIEDTETWEWIKEYAIPFTTFGPPSKGGKYQSIRKAAIVYCTWDEESVSRINHNPVDGSLQHWI